MKNPFLLSAIAILSVILLLSGCNAPEAPEINTYDARIEAGEILTPLPTREPRINSPARYGCTPEKPLVYRVPTQGERPIRFSARGLPEGVSLDVEKGILSGNTPAEPGEYTIAITAKNRYGKDRKKLILMVGEQLALTPPMGWNHWYTHYHYVTDGHIREAAMNMVESGMADVGYSFKHR
jgi:alpha-galactosidase